MIARPINLLSTTWVSIGLDLFGTTGGTVVVVRPGSPRVLLGASGKSLAMEREVKNTTAKTVHRVQLKDAPGTGSAGKQRPSGGRILAALGNAGHAPKKEYSGSL